MCQIGPVARALLLLSVFTTPFSAPTAWAADQLPAFPGAGGYGQMAQGGRGGRIVPVTNLDDSGIGSLRACIGEFGPRSCIFRVGGIIHLERPIMVERENSDLSILGQTAPGDGILITIDHSTDTDKKTPFIVKGASNILIRHIRIRPRFPNSVRNVDALTVESSSDIYIDHVSGSWATDENFNSYADATNLTVAYSLFGEGLNKHSKCALLGSDPTKPQRISFWRNACVSNRDRNPDNNHYGGSCIEIVNNLLYNARSEWGEIFSQYSGGTPISYVGNYFKAGPSTIKETFAINWNDTQSADPPQIFASGNETWSPKGKSVVMIAPDTEPYMVNAPPCGLAVDDIGGATAAYREVTERAGAFPRDAVDRRLIEEIGPIGNGGQGSMKSAPGDLPPMQPGVAYVDADGDGMADSVEAKFGGEAGVYDPWIVSDGSGWSNLDRFMQWLSEERLRGQYPE